MGRTEVCFSPHGSDVWCKTKLFPLLIEKSTLKLHEPEVRLRDTDTHIAKMFLFCFFQWSVKMLNCYSWQGPIFTFCYHFEFHSKKMSRSKLVPLTVSMQVICRVTHTVPNSCIILFVVPLISERWVSKNHRNLYPFI